MTQGRVGIVAAHAEKKPQSWGIPCAVENQNHVDVFMLKLQKRQTRTTVDAELVFLGYGLE